MADFVLLDHGHGFIVGVGRGSRAMEVFHVDEHGKVSCLRSIAFDEALTRWAVSADGSSLLGSGPRLHARWPLVPPPKAVESNRLIADACKINVAEAESRYSSDDWRAATYLDPPEDKLCSP